MDDGLVAVGIMVYVLGPVATACILVAAMIAWLAASPKDS
jgi:hypothetical protein